MRVQLQEIEGPLDWLPPWHWEPWNQNWAPLPKDMQWPWELVDPELSVAASDDRPILAGMDTLDQLEDELTAVGATQSVSDILRSSQLGGRADPRAVSKLRPEALFR